MGINCLYTQLSVAQMQVMNDSANMVAQKIRQAMDELAVEGIMTKLSFDGDAGIIKVYTEKSDGLKKASSGITDVLELAYTTAEHHPYWGMLYHATEISRILLEKWDTELSMDNLSEIAWRCDEIKMTQERVSGLYAD
jgi:hypothetical protein